MTQTAQEFMQEHAIVRVSVERVTERPDGIAWGKTHYLHVFSHQDGFLEVYVSHGAIDAPPATAAEAFSLAVSDARDGRMDAFEWLETFYGDTALVINFREARLTWEATRKARRNLRDFLGSRLFERAIRQVEEE